MLAGGTESMSNAPYLLPGRAGVTAWATRKRLDTMLSEGLTCAIKGCHMGITAENIVERYGISRADQDAFAAESQRRAQQAIESGAFKDEIVAVPVPKRKGESDSGGHRRISAGGNNWQRSWPAEAGIQEATAA